MKVRKPRSFKDVEHEISFRESELHNTIMAKMKELGYKKESHNQSGTTWIKEPEGYMIKIKYRYAKNIIFGFDSHDEKFMNFIESFGN